MRILVCFKTVPDFDQVVEEDWESFSLASDLSYVKRIFGCFDETALETALRLKDSLKDVFCGAITLGPLPAPLGKTLFAAGFDEVFAASSPMPEFRPVETAAALAELIRGGGWDLILTGSQAGWADTGQVPLLLAEALGLPAVTGAQTLAPLAGEEAAIAVERSGGYGRERIGLRLPALVVMGNSPVSALRAVSLQARMRAAKRTAAALVLERLPEPGEERLIRERPLRKCRFPGIAGYIREIKEHLEGQTLLGCQTPAKKDGRRKVCGSNLVWEPSAELPVIIPPEEGPWLLSRETLEPYQANPLESAALVFAAGRGLGSAAACERLRGIAARFGAPLGFSRPAALNGWGKIGDIIGQSGVKTQAGVCVVLGASGAAAFMAGVEGAGFLAAVNPDKDAPIFQYADMGLAAAAEEFMSVLENLDGTLLF